jgi:peptide/nickel transport system substrate-binding protein
LKKSDETLYKSKGFNIEPTTYNAYQYLAFNLTMDAFKDKRVRQAFAYAMDRDSVVNNFLEGHGVVANNPYPPTFWAAPKGLKEYKYDPKKAIELFKEAGWVYNEGEKKMYINGKPAKFVLKYSKGNPVTEKSAPLLQQNLKDVGIELDLQIMEFGVMFDQAKKGDFELAFIGQGNENDGDISKFYLSKYIKPVGDNSGSNFIRYSNPELDKLIDESLKHIDQNERTEIFNKIGLLLNEELPVVYRYHWDENIVYSGKLKGREFVPIAETYYYKIENWYLEK